MTTSMHLTLHPWLHQWADIGADNPEHEHFDHLGAVAFYETVDLDTASTGGTRFLRMHADDWFALGFPKEVTVTISKRKDETDARSDGG